MGLPIKLGIAEARVFACQMPFETAVDSQRT